MNKLIKLLAVAAPLALSLNANAATYTVVDAAQGSTYTNNFTNTLGALSDLDSIDGVFIDHIVFNLTSASTITLTGTNNATAVLLNTGDPLYSFISADFVSPLSLTATLAAGFYQADFKSTDGVFTGALSVAAVPEPETYAMLLAGLGLIGFSARRRQA
jgi:hypothetical protein